MDKPVTTAPEAAAAIPDVRPATSAPAKATSTPEVATPTPSSDAERAKAEKALRLAKALRENLRRRKVATKPARQSN